MFEKGAGEAYQPTGLTCSSWNWAVKSFCKRGDDYENAKGTLKPTSALAD